MKVDIGTVASITGSNSGIHLNSETFKRLEISDIKEILNEKGFLLVKDMDWTLEDNITFCKKMGHLISNEDRPKPLGQREGAVLSLSGSEKKEHVLTGRGALPLHSDGLLVDTTVSTILLYCFDHDKNSGGETFVSHQESAMKSAPSDILEILEKNDLEYIAHETSYFTYAPEGWFPIPKTRHHNGKQGLFIGLPFKNHESKSWSVRIKNFSEEESNEILSRLDSHLRSEEYWYEHSWEEGDLLLVNNFKMLHGRNEFTGKRNVINLQVSHE